MALNKYVDLTGLGRFLSDVLVNEIIEETEGSKIANITETKRAPSVSATYNYVQGEISDVVEQMTVALGAKLSEVKYDSTNKKITAKNGTTKDVVTVDTIRSDMDAFGASGSNHKKGLVPDPGATAGTSKFLREDATWAEVSTTDTKNTAGATDTSSKIYIIGATSQDANPQTYSHDTAYVGTDGCLYSDGQKVLTQHQDISGKADKATTLAGYGITDANISNGVITLGANTITPLTQHQDISGKADKATTLAGYGITDAYISGSTITLGSSSITPITSHQDISGKADLASPAFTGTPTAPTAASGTNTTQIATTAFVKAEINSVLEASDAMRYKGTLGTGGTVTNLPNPHSQGDTYKVITAGTYAGVSCEVGDMIICLKDGTTASDADWTVVQANIDGAVTGPSSSISANVAVFDGTTGKVIKDSGYTIATSVPSGAVFTDEKVKSTSSSVNSSYPLLINNGANATTSNALINSSMSANPSTGEISATSFLIGGKVKLSYQQSGEDNILNISFV